MNAGTHPEPRELSAGLSDLGHHVEYITGSQFRLKRSFGNRFALVRRLVAASAHGRLLSRDFSPEVILSSTGLALEVLTQILKRKAPGLAQTLLLKRTAAVDASAARRIRRSRRAGSPYDLVVVQQTSGSISLEAAGDESVRALLQPIVDQEWLTTQLTAEAARNPEWAYALQGLNRPESQSQRIERELQLADVVLAGSQLVADSISGRFAGPVIVEHYGHETELVGKRVRRHLPDRPLRVLFAGQVNQRKGISYLIDAVKLVDFPVALRLVGPISKEIAAHIERDAPNGTVAAVGPVSRSALTKEYLNADILVLPSLGEGFALVVVEAMSTGLPCIVTRFTGSHEVIRDGDNGLIVEACSAEAIAAAISKAVANDLLPALSKRAAETASSLNWQRYRSRAALALASHAQAMASARMSASRSATAADTDAPDHA